MDQRSPDPGGPHSSAPRTLTFTDATTPGRWAKARNVTRTWIATDVCGNSSTASQTIHVVDTHAPVITGVGPDGTIECPGTPSFSDPTASDACGPATLTFSDATTPGNCANARNVTRTWTATDACGNSSTASQTIHVVDTTAPHFTFVPAGGTIQCPQAPNFGDPTANDACGPATITFSDATTPGRCANTYDVTRTWTATDACGNAVTAAATIHVVDTTPPTLHDVPPDATVECSNVPPPPTVTATDACDPNVHVDLGEAIIILESPNPPESGTACIYQITRTWTATDACGNTATASQKLTVKDTQAPTVVSCPGAQTIQCPATPSFGTPQFADNCDTNLDITFADVTTPGSCANAHDVTRTWTAKDNCNNAATCSQTIHVVDTTPPALVCPGDINTGACNATVTYSTTAPDACGGPVTIVFTPPSGSQFPVGTTTVHVTATDACGNAATCDFKVNVSAAPTADITGDDAVCDGQTTQLCGPDGSFTWHWTGPGGYTADTRCITVGAAGTYSLTVTDPVNHCSLTGSHDLAVNPKPQCSITGPASICQGASAQLCGPDGNYSYSWTGPSGYTNSNRCITVSAAGNYQLVVMDNATKCSSDACSHALAVNTCIVNCPRTPGFWSQQCPGSSAIKFTDAQMTSIIACIDAKVAIFNNLTRNKFCSIVSASKTDQRTQAKRQFIAFLANLCVDELNITANNGDVIILDPTTPITPCAGLTSTTLGGLVAEIDTKLLALDSQNLKNASVKTAYSQIIECLDGINNGRTVGATCSNMSSYYDPGTFSNSAFSDEGADLVELYLASPNPFQSSTRIAYLVGGSGQDVHMGIYDIAGRKIRTLVDGFQAGGRYEVTWDGSSDVGGKASAGVYFVRSITGTELKMMRVIYVR